MGIPEDIRAVGSAGEEAALQAIARLAGHLEFEVLSAISDAAVNGTQRVRVAAEKASVECAKSFSENLVSLFDLVPWDDSLVGRKAFEEAYEAAARMTERFQRVSEEQLIAALVEHPPILVVLRTITGYTYDQLARACEVACGKKVGKDRIKALETLAMKPDGFPRPRDLADIRALGTAIYRAVSRTLTKPPTGVDSSGYLDRQCKVDTHEGWLGVGAAATRGITYSDLLYERYLGRPFAYLQDALSEKKGGLLESAVSRVLAQYGVPYHQTAMRERVPGFEPAPDFLIPTKDGPDCVVESKLTEDGGTARDKAARIFKLGETCRKRGITLVAFVDGKGFERLNDVLAPILRWTRGWTFCLRTVHRIVEVPAIARHVRR